MASSFSFPQGSTSHLPPAPEPAPVSASAAASYEALSAQIRHLPMPVRQVLYTQLAHDLESVIPRSVLDAFDLENTLQLWQPVLTGKGRETLETQGAPAGNPLLQLLAMAAKGKNVITLCLLHHWSLEQGCILLTQALEQNLVEPPRSGIIQATLAYLGNQTRLGEYLIKIGVLTDGQLDEALRTQRYIADAMGEHTPIGNVLINLGYIQKRDTEAILFLKQESRKPLAF